MSSVNSIAYRSYLSAQVLLQLLLAVMLAAGVAYWQLDFIDSFFFRNQLTATGWAINGAIVALGLIGLLKILLLLFHYLREERALSRFLAQVRRKNRNPLQDVAEGSIISRRYLALEELFKANAPINHGAFASTLVASEGNRLSLPKFIHNILILTGVFGTIVSLSIALLGASEILESAVTSSGMGLVVHGMSTALSTTITAILCYIFVGYFYLKLNDVQTNLISAVEQTTAQYMIPRFQLPTDNIIYEFAGLVRSLQGLVNQMQQSQSTFEIIEKQVMHTLEQHSSQVRQLSGDVQRIETVLRDGFRLPDPET